MNQNDQLAKNSPIINDLQLRKEVFWLNPNYQVNQTSMDGWKVNTEDIAEACERLNRFAPFIEKAFPETKEMKGIIESPLKDISNMKVSLEQSYHQLIQGNLLLKCDNELPISGSIKARGGIYEVLKHVEELAISHNLLKIENDYSILLENEYREFFSKFSIAVGSTGNLGLSIGIIGAKLGFKVTVHMSHDAKKWKKDLLRSIGVCVIEHESDYTIAVEEGRKQASLDPYCYFIDDENSKHLFLGYAVAAERLKKQLSEAGIVVNKENPLFVYLPCGVGGGPGGITFGLKSIFHENVHCFFAEPLESPCMLLGMATGLNDRVSVQEFGLSNHTVADGLAVGRASQSVINNMRLLLSGIYTVKDESLLELLKDFWEKERVFLEPSAVAGAIGPIHLLKSENGRNYIEQNQLVDKMANGTHIIWATGGSMVPESIREELLSK